MTWINSRCQVYVKLKHVPTLGFCIQHAENLARVPNTTGINVSIDLFLRVQCHILETANRCRVRTTCGYICLHYILYIRLLQNSPPPLQYKPKTSKWNEQRLSPLSARFVNLTTVAINCKNDMQEQVKYTWENFLNSSKIDLKFQWEDH